ncbi:porin family protein [Agarilytica rhodophyticola]|uniref:porin family protein n=1 Tax=Agarilytica rhodophyticola TaxID=1737490 RepID=UPI000B340F34|nr:porin family protein [Agarilytica rhodophyticola]
MRFLTLASLILLANSAAAESIFEKLDRFYVGGGVSFIDANTSDASGNDLNFTTLDLVGGYKYNGFLGVDARIGLGISDETSTIAGNEIETSTDYYASIYWRPETVNDRAKIYGLFGFSTISVSVDSAAGDNSNSESGLSYGGGVGFVIEESWNLNFEYRMILDDDDNEFSTVSANVDYRF